MPRLWFGEWKRLFGLLNESLSLFNFVHNSILKHLIQYRTRFLFPGTTKKSVPSKLTENEEQSIRYVAGYIGCSLKKAFKHSKSSEGKAMFHLICQFSAKYDDELEDTWYFNDFLEYTQLWVNHINRGGLQEVNDQFFLLIRSMEFVVRTILDLNFLITYAGEDLRSILFDKIIERLMHKRLVSFFECHKIINPSQYGFQKDKSTFMAIL